MIVIDETEEYFDTIELMNKAGGPNQTNMKTRRLVVDDKWLIFISTYDHGWDGSISCLDGHTMTKPEFNKAMRSLMYHRVVPKCQEMQASSFPDSIVMHFRATK